MLLAPPNNPDRLPAVRRLKGWTRDRFGLDEAAVVMAAEIACDVPGCPPIETVVAFWTGDGTRYRFKVFKPIADVVYDDLPYGWLLNSLFDDGGIGLECC